MKPIELTVPIIMPEDVINIRINEEIRLLEDKLNTELEVEERMAINCILRYLIKKIEKGNE